MLFIMIAIGGFAQLQDTLTISQRVQEIELNLASFNKDYTQGVFITGLGIAFTGVGLYVNSTNPTGTTGILITGIGSIVSFVGYFSIISSHKHLNSRVRINENGVVIRLN